MAGNELYYAHMAHTPEGPSRRPTIDSAATPAGDGKHATPRARVAARETGPAPDEFFAEVTQRADVREILEQLAKR